MSAFTKIDLSQLAAPDIIEALDYETILADLKQRLAASAPEIAPVLELESEPLVKFLEELALESVYLRARVNDAARAVMLASATGTDLENLGALFGVTRLSGESDTDFRNRIQLSLEGFTSCGTLGAYTFWALSADQNVKDVFVESVTPGTVDVTVLSRVGDGTADASLLAAVQAQLDDPDIRQLCDTVNVKSATVIGYTIDATLHLDSGPDASVVLAQAQANIDQLITTGVRLGRRASRSAIHAALTVPGVAWVDLTSPAADVVPGSGEVAHCSAQPTLNWTSP